MIATLTEQFIPFAERLEAEGAHPIFIELFSHYYDQLVAGQTGLIPESSIEPVLSLPDAERLPADFLAVGRRALARTAVIKLNGGLGTGMGLEQAKSLLMVKEGLTFLDVIASQAKQINVPLLLMNSFATEDDTQAALAPYAHLPHPPVTFVQNKEPKIRQSDLMPVSWPENPELEWCPPGHGDLYASLVISGVLDKLLDGGFEYAFISNSDNLGAVVDPAILGYFVQNELPFMMEVADRTEMDKKGGHLAQRADDGQLILRESAQCPAADEAAFQDINRHKYFNTNNLWLNLVALQEVMEERNNRLGLPLIRNSKTVDPRDGGSTAVYQLETAMGSAISVFADAQAIRVPRSRFAPVKKSDDLLAVRSDAYILTEDYQIVFNPAHVSGDVVVELDGRYYKFVNDLAARFPEGIPSLLNCTRLSVQGDVTFCANVSLVGDVEICNKSGRSITIPAGTTLSGQHLFE
jgi:UTP--glucose-1-phosphate uridylyltransferase